MSDTLAKLTALGDAKPFTPYEEEAVIALILDHPNLFDSAIKYLRPELFARIECSFVISEILKIHAEHAIVPTRQLLRSQIEHSINVDDPFEQVFQIVDRKSDPREAPLIKKSLIKWLRQRAFGLLYSPEAIEAYHAGNVEQLAEIVEEANKITDVNEHGFWFLESFEALLEPQTIDHRTTGFPQLDRVLNNGGPSKKEVVCWLAPTNVGKSLVLCNNAITSLKGMNTGGEAGQDVLLFTFELDAIKTAMRCLGAATSIPLNLAHTRKDEIRRRMLELKEYGKRLCICELSPDECSTADLQFILDKYRRVEGFRPDVVVIDYMDLMISRNKYYNRGDYERLKHVSSEVRGLAKKEDVLVFTATQTNRGGMQSSTPINMTKSAESFGKNFPLDYVISLNQTEAERLSKPAKLQMYVDKNRNGPRLVTVDCHINYDSMQVHEART